eukprot:maker-scaffold_1-snap-gene-22.65-mRNA-1 protein AED:0.07 eAED:0.26 QI:155/0.5/0.33/1/0.5/0.33/3/0/199
MNEDENIYDDEFFNKYGDKILAKFARVKQRASPINLIYTCPVTGRQLYTGTHQAATDKEILDKHNIYGIVNCTKNLANVFEHEAAKYFRQVVNLEISREIYKFVSEIVYQVDTWFQEGKNVLIHCHAGAHRAGTATTIFLMAKLRLPFLDALEFARKRRPCIDPYIFLEAFLEKLDEVIAFLQTEGKLEDATLWHQYDI